MAGAIHNYVDVIREYREVLEKMDELNAKKEELRDKIAQNLHLERINEKIVEVDDTKWKCAYQTSTRKSVNYRALYEAVGAHKYAEIVSENPVDSLIIRKAPKKGENNKDLKSQRPVNSGPTEPPTGVLA